VRSNGLLVHARAVLAAVLSAALSAGCGGTRVDLNAQTSPKPGSVRHATPAASIRRPVNQLIAEHRTGQRTVLTRAAGEQYIRTFINAAKLLPSTHYRINCHSDLDLTLAKHGHCTLSYDGRSIPYDVWVDDSAHQLRIGGHGFAIETNVIRNAIAASIQKKLPRMGISPYDVQCTDDPVVVIAPGSRMLCVFTAGGMLMLLSVRIYSLTGHLQVERLK
jgi:hypothetical protein